MNILSIDCSTGLKIALITDKFIKKYVDDSEKKQSAELITKIDNLLKDNDLTISKIDAIAVCVGPGSFTGIRVAISVAKGLAVGAKAKVLTFNSFECIDGLPKDNYSVLVEGFGQNYYYYTKKFGREFKGCATPDFLQKITDGTQRYTLSKLVKENLPLDVTLGEYNVDVLVEKAKNNQFILTNQIAPLYLRASQAEIDREKNGN